MSQTFLLTGAGSGFGKGVAFTLAKAGHRVIAGAQIWPQVTALRREAAQQGLQLEVIKLDLLEELDRRHALTYEVDVLFNNAGIAHSGTVTDLPMALLRASFETNVFAALELTKGFIAQMLPRGRGKIVFTSSDAGLMAPPFGGAYNATKHAIESIADNLYQELHPKGIQVATVNPGAYDTGFNDTALEYSSYWYDPATALLPGIPPPYVLPDQADPQAMVDEIVKVLTGESDRYRTVYPPAMVQQVREAEQQAWTRRV